MGVLSAIARRAGLGAATMVSVAAGAALGLAAERYAVGRGRSDPQSGERLGELLGHVGTVRADDGVSLFVEVIDNPTAPLTVVLVHGYAVNLDSWHYQRRDLDDVARLVLYDQCGHGRSGRGSVRHATFEQLGADLHRVITNCVPDGPIVLVGHSMGGMSVMAYAEQHREAFGQRVVGVAFIATSPGRLAEVTLGIPSAIVRGVHRVAPSAVRFVSKGADVIERGRRTGSDLTYVLTKRYSFASDVPPSLVQFVAEMIAATPVEVLAELFPAFDAHDRLDALEALDGIEVLVLVGDGDLMTPAAHSRDIVTRVPGAELVVVHGGGHMVMLEHHQVVNEHLRALIERALRATEAA